MESVFARISVSRRTPGNTISNFESISEPSAAVVALKTQRQDHGESHPYADFEARRLGFHDLYVVFKAPTVRLNRLTHFENAPR